MVGIGLLLSNSIALPLQQHHANLDSNSFNSNANLENSSNYQTSYDTSLLSSGTNAGWASSKPFMIASITNSSSINFSYKENGLIMASGDNRYGHLGNTTNVNVGEPFALYKEGDSSQPFVDVVDYSIGGISGVIDSTGKLWTSGYNSTGSGNIGIGEPGYSGDYGSGYHQYSFQPVITQSNDLVAVEDKANALPDDYKAVSVQTGWSTGLLLNDGTLYGIGDKITFALGTTQTTAQQYHFTRLDGRATGLPQATSSNKIKDFSNSYQNSWVLYENGELYMTCNSSALREKYTLVASDIKFFDQDERGRVYAVNTSNQILSCGYTSSTLETFVENPVGTVTQVRGSASGGWGYLNSNNELYLSTTAEGVVPGAANGTQTQSEYFYKMDNVAFFDLGGNSSSMTYGVMYTNGSMTVWGDNSYGQLGNGEVGNGDTTDPDYVPSNPETGAKPEIEFAPEDIPNVEEDNGGFKDPELLWANPPAIFLKKM